MKWFAIVTILLPFLGKAQSSYADSLTLERQIHDEQFFKEVLNEEEKAALKQVCYFTIDTTYIVTATFRTEKGKRFIMPMSKERVVYYKKIGVLEFKLKDTLCSLMIFKNLSLRGKKFKNYYFLPFRDGTSGKTSYGGGRYMDLELTSEQLKSGKVILDFNTCYHPYCAYSSRYSCPIVDPKNKITPKVEAGECYTLAGHEEEEVH